MTFDFVNQGWVGIVVGLLISYYFYRKAHKEPLLCVASKASKVLGLPGSTDYAEDVKIQFRGNDIGQLSVVVVTFWNAGTATLSGSTIVERDPLRIESQGSKEGKILDAKIIRRSKEACGPELVVVEIDERSTVMLKFDYLDPQDGFAVRILHTAAQPSLKIDGSLRGVRRVDESHALATKWDKIWQAIRAFVPLLAPVALMYWYGADLKARFTQYNQVLVGVLAVVAFAASFVLALSAVIWALQPKYKMPELLRLQPSKPS
jgi:hypothetical protein